MLRNLVLVKLTDQRIEEANNTIYLYHIDPLRSLPTAEKAKYIENETLKQRMQQRMLGSADKIRLDTNNAAINLELKKLGLAIQRIAANIKKPFSSGSVRVRLCDTNTTNNTYNIVLEHHGMLEVHTDVPIPLKEEIDKKRDVDYSKITVSEENQRIQVEDLDFSVIADGRQKSVFTSAYAGGALLSLKLPTQTAAANGQENKFEDSTALLTPQQRVEALQLFPVQNNILAQLDTHASYLHTTNNTIEDNQARVDEITANIAAQANLPEEVKALWLTASATATQLNTETEAQNKRSAEAHAQLNYASDQPSPNLKQAAERSLIYNYGIHKGHERFLLKPAETGTAKALRLTALQYFKIVSYSFSTDSKGVFKDKTNNKITEFNLKFAGIATIKSTPIGSGRQEAVLCFDQSLSKKNLAQLAEITNDLIIACTYYQGRTGYSDALKFITANLQEKSDIKQKYRLVTIPYSEAKPLFLARQQGTPVVSANPPPFQWLDTISDVNRQAPPDDTRVLSNEIKAFALRIQNERSQVDSTTTKIQALQTTIDEAIRETADKTAELAQLKAVAANTAMKMQKALAKLEEEARALELVRNAMVTTAKTRRSSDLDALAAQLKTRDPGERITNKFERLTENIATLRQHVQNLASQNLLAQSSNSIVAVQQQRASQEAQLVSITAVYPKITGAIDTLKNIKTTLDKVESEALQAEAREQEQQRKAQQAAEKAAAAEREQQRLARLEEERVANAALQAEQQLREAAAQTEANRQREKDRQQLVIDTAKKFAHLLSDITYWHKQVRLFGGVTVPNPDGGTSSVPHGVSEMLKHKNTLNLASLTYDEAARFMGEMKKIGDAADSRGSWRCCYPVRKTGTTGALYNYASDFNILIPPQAAPSKIAFDNIHPGWEANYGVVNSQTPLLSDAPDVVLHSSSPSRST